MILLCMSVRLWFTDSAGKLFLTVIECCMWVLQTEDPTSLFPILFLACVDLLISCHAYSLSLESLHWAQILLLLCSFVWPFYFGTFFPWYVLDQSTRTFRSLFQHWSKTSATLILSSVVPLSFCFCFFKQKSKPKAEISYSMVKPYRKIMWQSGLKRVLTFLLPVLVDFITKSVFLDFWKTCWFSVITCSFVVLLVLGQTNFQALKLSYCSG